MIRVTLYLTHI